MRSVDASTQVKDARMLFTLLDQFVQEEGVEHVVK